MFLTIYQIVKFETITFDYLLISQVLANQF